MVSSDVKYIKCRHTNAFYPKMMHRKEETQLYAEKKEGPIKEEKRIGKPNRHRQTRARTALRNHNRKAY